MGGVLGHAVGRQLLDRNGDIVGVPPVVGDIQGIENRRHAGGKRRVDIDEPLAVRQLRPVRHLFGNIAVRVVPC